MAYTTSIFLPNFSSERLADFPRVLEPLLLRDDVLYYDGPYNSDSSRQVRPATEQELALVHSASMIELVKQTPDYEGAAYSAGATVQAALSAAESTTRNAFVFTGFGDHHAGRDFFGGGCYFNGATIAIAVLRAKTTLRRFAILDTDAHHADGTRDIAGCDTEVLHVCFCSQDYHDSFGNVDVPYPSVPSVEEYVQLVHKEFGGRVHEFRPEMIFWEFGYDSTRGDYGDRGVASDSHWRTARAMVDIADNVCDGRLVVILCGGSRRDYARKIIPPVIRELATHRI